MNLALPKALILFAVLCSANQTFAQYKSPPLPLSDNSKKAINLIRENESINVDSTYKILNSWSQYPDIGRTGQEYIYYYNDALFGEMPVRIYIPESYENTRRSPCVLMLHGAVGRSTFADIDSLDKFDSDVLFSTLKKQGYIVIRPVADRDKKFDWAVNRFGGRGSAPNPTFKTLTDILTSLKKILNIDDNRVFAFGHSDGSDGAIGLAVYTPDIFAGFVAYNSMLNNIHAKDFYIRNLKNSPAYIVHSDLDDLRPIQQTRVIIDALTKTDNHLTYKEYIGYQHEDKHLDKDVAFSVAFMNSQSRNPFKSIIFWEANRTDLYNSCNWLKITGIDTTIKGADWHTSFNFDSYNKKNKTWWKEFPYYFHLQKNAGIKAFYNNNIFNIETSRVTELELLISPVMVNIENPVIVNVNGKLVFKGKISADKDFLLKKFENDFDRQALWVNAIKIKLAQ